MKKETVKSAINLAAVILVPLISERDRIKDHEEVQKAKDLSLKAFDTTKRVTNKTKKSAVNTTQKIVTSANSIKNATVNTAQFVGQKAENTKKTHNYNQQMKQHLKQEKSEQKQEKNLKKEITKLNNNLASNIESRHSAENKELSSRQKAMIKEMKQYKNYVAKAPLKETNHFTPEKPKKIHRRDKKAINQLSKNLSKTIDARHNEEEQLIQKQQKAMIKEMEQYKNYKFKSPKQKRSLFGFNKNKKTNDDTRTNMLKENSNIVTSTVSLSSIPSTLQPTEKAKSNALKVEEQFDNAQLFEQHRKLMAEHIVKR
ncbi:hypothetical protein [Macrococcus animalis]|uniref:hypothetical protein n=1 Tax=Macrococcus animalis TaxID=3395467 RepID=UPI0039BDD783